MGLRPPNRFRTLIHRELKSLLERNPLATVSESFIQHHIEFFLLNLKAWPRYFVRIGINFHGGLVQELKFNKKGVLIGWNPKGDPLGIRHNAKIILSGPNGTIVSRESNEPMMSDSKFGGGCLPHNRYIRLEYKVRGWLGKTKNLDGKQLEKDLDLLKRDKADLLVVCLSETAHLKWRGHGPEHQASRRTSVNRFKVVLPRLECISSNKISSKCITFENQKWRVTAQRAYGRKTSPMPGALHSIILISKR